MGSGGVVLNICYLGAMGIPGASSVYAKPDALQYSLRHTEEKKEEKEESFGDGESREPGRGTVLVADELKRWIDAEIQRNKAWRNAREKNTEK